MFRIQILAAVALVMNTALGATLFGDRILARGKNLEVKASEVEERYIAYKAGRVTAGQPVPQAASDIEKVEAEILDTLITTKLLLARANEADLTNGLAQAAKFIEEKKTNAPSEAAFKRQILAAGMTYEQFEKEVRDQGIIKAVVDREVRVKQTVTEEQIEKFYKENTKLFEEPQKWKVAHVYLGNRERGSRAEISEAEKARKRANIAEVLLKAKAGVEFAKLVREHSEHALTRDTGGETTFSSGQMPPEFEAASASMKPGQISDVISSGLGWHIIKFIEHIPAKTSDFASVKEKIRESLLTEATQKAITPFALQLREEAGVEIVPAAK